MGGSGEAYPEGEDLQNTFDPFSEEYDNDYSTMPLAKKPAHISHLWKRPITFVPAGAASPEKVPTPPKAVAVSFADMFYSVYPQSKPVDKPQPPICEVCKGPIAETTDSEHFSSLTHQQSLHHLPRPSNIDRSRMGLKYLEKYGFDVDARVGLGAEAQGILFPIKSGEKRDRLGIGMGKKEVEKKKKPQEAPKKACLGAGKVRKQQVEDMKKHAKLTKMFYGNDDEDRLLLGLPKVDYGLKK